VPRRLLPMFPITLSINSKWPRTQPVSGEAHQPWREVALPRCLVGRSISAATAKSRRYKHNGCHPYTVFIFLQPADCITFILVDPWWYPCVYAEKTNKLFQTKLACTSKEEAATW
jgi:hypothetical protein